MKKGFDVVSEALEYDQVAVSIVLPRLVYLRATEGKE